MTSDENKKLQETSSPFHDMEPEQFLSCLGLELRGALGDIKGCWTLLNQEKSEEVHQELQEEMARAIAWASRSVEEITLYLATYYGQPTAYDHEAKES